MCLAKSLVPLLLFSFKKMLIFFVIFKCMYLCVLVCGYVGPSTQGGQRHWVSLSLKLQAAVNYAMRCWEWTKGLC